MLCHDNVPSGLPAPVWPHGCERPLVRGRFKQYYRIAQLLLILTAIGPGRFPRPWTPVRQGPPWFCYSCIGYEPITTGGNIHQVEVFWQV